MALDAYDVLALGEGEELILQSLVSGSHHEADVHYGTVFLLGGADEQRVAVDLSIKRSGLLLIDSVDGVDAADALEPLQGLVHHEDAEHRRGVEHRFLVEVHAVVEHRGDVAADLAEST